VPSPMSLTPVINILFLNTVISANFLNNSKLH
jgi:hypothetical protein